MTEPVSRETLESMAAVLEASGAYKVLRRLEPPAAAASPSADARLGLVIDVETTGDDARQHEVIELAMVRFVYTPDGWVLGVHTPFRPTRSRAAPFRPRSRP